ncbi:MAG: hypothetical protein LBD78_11305 [Spirochaetaceae bacterium]|jgi:hypothetical protein|nr:hypothetical protein [Spirochaetaceae bacterium]
MNHRGNLLSLLRRKGFEYIPSSFIYYSCGYVLPFIEDLIDAGVDVLNPIQTESMDYREVAAAFGDRLFFHGCIGTQRLMPFGAPAEVRAAVHEIIKRTEYHDA